MINFLETAVTLGVCDGKMKFAFEIARFIIRILQIAVPFALIIWGALDFFKAVIAGDEKEMKQKRKPFMQRVIAALIIVLLPSLVNLIMKNLASKTQSTFATCWDQAKDGANGKFTLPDEDESIY